MTDLNQTWQSMAGGDGNEEGGAMNDFEKGLDDFAKKYIVPNATLVLCILVVLVLLFIYNVFYMGKKMSENLTNPTGLMREQQIQGVLAEYADMPAGSTTSAAVATAPSTSPTTNAAVASAAQAVASAAANVAASVTQQAATAAQNNKDVTFVSRNYDSKYVLAAPEFDCANRVPSTDNAWAWMNQVAREDACMPVAGGNSPCTNNAFSAIMAGY